MSVRQSFTVDIDVCVHVGESATHLCHRHISDIYVTVSNDSTK